MSVLENFKNIPRSPCGRATGLKCIFFFFKFATKSLKKKKEGACRPPQGRPTSGPSLQAPGGRVAPPAGDRGGLSPPLRGRPGQPSLYKASPLIPSSFDLKKSTKNPEKREGEEKGSGEALPNSALVIYR